MIPWVWLSFGGEWFYGSMSELDYDLVEIKLRLQFNMLWLEIVSIDIIFWSSGKLTPKKSCSLWGGFPMLSSIS